MSDDGTISLALFSGTEDKLQAAAVLVTGAAIMGRPVHVFLQYWALDAFRADRVYAERGIAPEGGEEGLAALRKHAPHPLARAVPAGEGRRRRRHPRLCGLDGDVELSMDDLDPLVDGVWGVASFFGAADEGAVTFI